MTRTIVITDTSVLVNFLVLDQSALLARLKDIRFALTEHVRAEITAHYSEQLERLEQAFESQLFDEIQVNEIQELNLFAELSAKGLGLGECSAIAAAVHRGHALAIDDKQAIKKLKNLGYSVPIFTTEALMICLIKEGVLTIVEADAMKYEWETKHRFRLAISSFGDILDF
jgi:predicted nucleic acid-binding protein